MTEAVNLQIGIILLITVVLSVLVHFLLLGSARLTGRTKTDLDDRVIDALDRPIVFLILVIGIEIAFDQFSSITFRWLQYVEDGFFIVRWLILLLIVYRLINALVGWYGAEVAHRTETELDDKFLTLFRHIAVIIVTTIAIVMLLNHFEVDISAMVTTLGITSLAVALAAQDSLSNMMAGFFLMLDQPFREGHRIGIEEINTWGDVQEIGLRTTRILMSDHRLVSVPNSVIAKGLIVNYSLPDLRFRISTTVGIAYGSDIEAARVVMVDAIRQQSWVLADRRIEALFLEFGDSALNFRVRCWINSVIDTQPIQDKMNTALYEALNEAGIDIPFPQVVVHSAD